jgi:hypothetical protein
MVYWMKERSVIGQFPIRAAVATRTARFRSDVFHALSYANCPSRVAGAAMDDLILVRKTQSLSLSLSFFLVH